MLKEFVLWLCEKVDDPNGKENIPRIIPDSEKQPTANNTESKFCIECGSKLNLRSMFCTKCGTEQVEV